MNPSTTNIVVDGNDIVTVRTKLCWLEKYKITVL